MCELCFNAAVISTLQFDELFLLFIILRLREHFPQPTKNRSTHSHFFLILYLSVQHPYFVFAFIFILNCFCRSISLSLLMFSFVFFFQQRHFIDMNFTLITFFFSSFVRELIILKHFAFDHTSYSYTWASMSIEVLRSNFIQLSVRASGFMCVRVCEPANQNIFL